MATAATETRSALRQIFRTMDAKKAQKIRDAYYKAMDGLNALADYLEEVDAELDGDETHPLITEHFVALNALEAMEASQLGAIL